MDLEELKGEIQRLCWEIAGDRLDARALTRLAEQNGWYEDRQESSHHQFKHPDCGQYRFTLAYHGNNSHLDRNVVRNTVRAIFQPQIDKLLQQKTPDAIEKTITSLLDRLQEAISPGNISTDLSAKIDCAYQEAMQRIEAFEMLRLQEAESVKQELLGEIAPAHIQALQSQLNQTVAEYEGLVKTKQSLEAELHGERQQKEAAYQQLQRLEQHISRKETEIAALRTELAELRQALEQNQLHFETQRIQANTLEHQLRAQIRATQQIAEQRTSDLGQELEIARARQVQLQSERDRLAGQLRDREQALSQTISTLQIKLSQGAQEITTLQQQTHKAQADKHAAEQTLQNLQHQLRQLEPHNNISLTEQLSRLRCKNSNLQATLRGLQDQLSSTEQALQLLQGTHSDQNTVIKSLHYNLAALTAEKQRLETATQQLQTQLNRAEAERVQLQGRLSKFERLADDRQVARAKTSRDIERLEAELAEAKQQLATAVNQHSIRQWLSDVRTLMEAGGVKRWLVRAVVAVAVFCVSWISQVI